MTLRLATPVFLAWMLAMANSSGNETFVGEPQIEAITKYVNGVPIYNYQFFSKHAKKCSMNEKEATPFTTWMVKAHNKHDQKMREFCAFSDMGKRHCTWASESFSSFHFNGTQDELTIFLTAHNTMVEFVEPDFEVSIAKPELPGVVQSDAEWGLDRIDARKGVGDGYRPGLDGGHGKGIHVYVLDTGVRISHSDFQGRAVAGFDAIGNFRACSPKDRNCAADRHGHGTHCAGIVGGKKYGVAKDVKLHAGKVLSDRGSGSTSGVARGVDWVVTSGEKPAIISMSLWGAGRSSTYKSAIDAASNKGVVVVVAAGNENSDACKFSPAYVPSAITVGSTTNPASSRRRSGKDQMSSFSNYGSCLDIWAPGSDIKSCNKSCDNCSAVMSGTSMACAAVAGAVALVYAAHPGVPASQVTGLLKEHATTVPVIGQNRKKPKPNSTTDLLYVGAEWQVPGIDLSTRFAVYSRMPKKCVSGHNIASYKGRTVEQCGQICDETSSCLGFEYGVAYGGRGRKSKNGDCLPQDSADTTGCDGGFHNLDFYPIKLVYHQMTKACVSGHNIKLYHGKTREECAEICGKKPKCVGFEYGVAYGGGGRYKAGDCIPQDSADTSGCNGTFHNLDFYPKLNQSTLAEHQNKEQVVAEVSADGKLLQVFIGISAVVFIIISVKWHKSAREVQVKPLLG